MCVYFLFKIDGDIEVLKYLMVVWIDYCIFGNIKFFCICIINGLNDNYDYFYVKCVDVSRIYGFELEELFLLNFFMYFYAGNIFIEEYIVGIFGDDFIKNNLKDIIFN